MKKIKYFINRIIKMNYKNMFVSLNKIHKVSKKNRVFLFFSIVYSGFKYGAGYKDYELFEMYNLNKEQKQNILTRTKNNELILKLNNKQSFNIFDDKSVFNLRFKKYIKREFLDLETSSLQEFKKFLENKEAVFAKPKTGSCGKDIEKIIVKDIDVDKIYYHLKQEKIFLIENMVKNHPLLNKLYPNSLNTIRLVTIVQNKKVNYLFCFLKVGNESNVDNFNHGGLIAPVDIKKGEVIGQFFDKNQNTYSLHPKSKVKIIGFKIPMWNNLLKMIEEATLEVEDVKYVGWDIAVTKDNVCIIEGNNMPGHDIYAHPYYLKNNIEVYNKIKKVIK